MLTVVVANAADLFTFYLVAQIHPIAGEANPVVAPLWAISPWTVALLKAIGVALVLLIIAHAHPRIARVGTAVAVIVPMLGAVVNTLSGIM